MCAISDPRSDRYKTISVLEVYFTLLLIKVKVKILPITGHEGPEGE